MTNLSVLLKTRLQNSILLGYSGNQFNLRFRMVYIGTVIYPTSLLYMVSCFASKLVTYKPLYVLIWLPTLWIFVCLWPLSWPRMREVSFVLNPCKKVSSDAAPDVLPRPRFREDRQRIVSDFRDGSTVCPARKGWVFAARPFTQSCAGTRTKETSSWGLLLRWRSSGWCMHNAQCTCIGHSSM